MKTPPGAPRAFPHGDEPRPPSPRPSAARLPISDNYASAGHRPGALPGALTCGAPFVGGQCVRKPHGGETHTLSREFAAECDACACEKCTGVPGGASATGPSVGGVPVSHLCPSWHEGCRCEADTAPDASTVALARLPEPVTCLDCGCLSRGGRVTGGRLDCACGCHAPHPEGRGDFSLAGLRMVTPCETCGCIPGSGFFLGCDCPCHEAAAALARVGS